MPANQSHWYHKTIFCNIKLHLETLIVGLLFRNHIRKRNTVRQKMRPVCRAYYRIQFASRIPDGIQSPNNATHTGTRYIIWSDTNFLQHLYYPYMSKTLGSSTTKNQTNLWPVIAGLLGTDKQEWEYHKNQYDQ